ncbi:MAG: NADPH-dependent F420 reductase [Promethearchaeota archaeon]
MKIGIIGSGNVAQTLGVKFLSLKHEVMISSRDVSKDKGTIPSAENWVKNQIKKGYTASAGSFSEAAKFGELLFNCTAGKYSWLALETAGKENMKDKILVDIANPLDFSRGWPPTLTVVNDYSLGEQIQASFPETKVVKALNTLTAALMINPDMLNASHTLFICGNDEEAKKWVKDEILVKWFGWKDIIDLGDIKGSRGMEMYLMLWVRLYSIFDTANFNLKIIKEEKKE